jgi:hypothetical protein
MVDSHPDTSGSIRAKRCEIRSLLRAGEPGDARTAYYSLEHSPQRTALALHRSGDGRVDGFLAACITGVNPFQPLVVLRTPNSEALVALVDEVMIPGRSYLLSIPVHVGAALMENSLGSRWRLTVTEATVWRILKCEASRFVPLVNILVTRETEPGRSPRWEIRSGNRVVASAGVNWRSTHLAEVYVSSDRTGRLRRWDESVLASATAELLRGGQTPLYLVMQEDVPSREAAEALGYCDTGARELTCVAVVS